MQINKQGTPASAQWFLPVKEDAMDSVRTHSEPSEVNAEQGQVIVEGPNSVAVTLTPDAAEETGRRMIEAASAARLQEES